VRKLCRAVTHHAYLHVLSKGRASEAHLLVLRHGQSDETDHNTRTGFDLSLPERPHASIRWIRRICLALMLSLHSRSSLPLFLGHLVLRWTRLSSLEDHLHSSRRSRYHCWGLCPDLASRFTRPRHSTYSGRFVHRHRVQGSCLRLATERIAVLERVRDDQGGTHNQTLKKEQVIEAFLDIRTWLVVLSTMLSRLL
jgi:hypothetical protein